MKNQAPRLTRRGLLQRGSVAAAFGLMGRWPAFHLLNRPHIATRTSCTAIDGTLADPALVQRLALRALDAAKSAGAKYADVHLTRTLEQTLSGSSSSGSLPIDYEEVGIGVRTLVNGAWGFAGTSNWTDDDVTYVARAAVAQAKVNAIGVTQPIEFAPLPTVTGNWIMPVSEDPFLVPLETKLDVIQGIMMTAEQQLPRQSKVGGRYAFPTPLTISCYRQERALATTDGTYITQTVYRTGGELLLVVTNAQGRAVASTQAADLRPMGRGWESLATARVVDQLPRMVAEVDADSALPVKPVDVGQYDVVCDAMTMAGLVDATFGRATALDYALGDEANAGGTSYLGPDPMAWLGHSVASPLVNISANRSLAGGLATVKWDDEGVTPADVALISAGTLMDYQTTRDYASELSTWYTQQHQPVQSHGYAASEDARNIAQLASPNLALTPNPSGSSFEAMITSLGNGMAIVKGIALTDFQAKNGKIICRNMYEIKDGKRIARIVNGGIPFTATELWKNVIALGGRDSVAHVSAQEQKGQPMQKMWHTVSGAAATLKNRSVIDLRRKA